MADFVRKHAFPFEAMIVCLGYGQDFSKNHTSPHAHKACALPSIGLLLPMVSLRLINA